MIPKIIHYCWFGGNTMPKLTIKCIDSWKKYCPDYEIICWNEENYDLNKNDYVRETYRLKKYAFLSDYVRLDVVAEYGGIYLDTDVELIKPLYPLLKYDGFLGTEEIGRINTGLGFGAKKGHPAVIENKKFYELHNCLNKKGEFEKVLCVNVTTQLMEKHGYKPKDKIQRVFEMDIYPPKYFCPLKMGTNKSNITKNTFSIHHYEGSWKSGNRYWNRFLYYLIPLKQFIKRNILKKNLYE